MAVNKKHTPTAISTAIAQAVRPDENISSLSEQEDFSTAQQRTQPESLNPTLITQIWHFDLTKQLRVSFPQDTPPSHTLGVYGFRQQFSVISG
jgi:hypothetical protein